MVGETPSLGRAIHDLLETEGIPSRLLIGPATPALLQDEGHERPVVIVASNDEICVTGRRWVRADPMDVDLLIVGARDPRLLEHPDLPKVRLPIDPAEFLALIRAMLARRAARELERETHLRSDPPAVGAIGVVHGREGPGAHASGPSAFVPAAERSEGGSR